MNRPPQIIAKINPQTYQLRVVLTDKLRQHVGDEPPTEFIGEARLRMAALKSQGTIASFSIYEQKFHNIWHRFRKKKSVEYLEPTVAAGRPTLKGVNVKVRQDSHICAFLSIDASPFETAKWRPEWLKLLVEQELVKHNIIPQVDPAQVYGYWAKRAYNGAPIREQPLYVYQATNPLSRGEEAVIQANDHFDQLEVLFGTFKPFHLEARRTDLLVRVEDSLIALAKRSGSAGYWRSIPEIIESTIEACHQGEQSLGLEIPVNTLAGICLTDSPLAGDVVAGLPPGAAHLYANVLREMLRLEGAEFTPEWFMGKMLFPIAEDSINAVMAILQARGLVKQGERRGEFVLPPEIHAVGYRATETHINTFHKAAINAGISAVQLIPKTKASMIGHSLSVSESALAEMKARLKAFRERLLSIAAADKKPEKLLQLNVHLFPLTKLAADYRQIGTDLHRQNSEGTGRWLDLLVLDLAAMEVFRDESVWLAGKSLIPFTQEQCQSSLDRLKNSQLLNYSQQQSRFYDYRSHKLKARPEMDRLNGLYAEQMHSAVLLCCSAEQQQRFLLSTLFLPVSPLSHLQIEEECFNFATEIQRVAEHSRGKDQLYRLNLILFPQSSETKELP